MIKLSKQIKSLLLSSFNLKVIGLITLLLFSKSYNSQNLIQNGSFEKTTNLMCNLGPVTSVDYWQIISSPDFFNNVCNAQSIGVPNNKFGSCYPVTGNSYLGIATLSLPYETKEYIYQYLTNPLISNKTYYTSFFLSKSDRTRIATEKVGAYFSVNQPTVSSGTAALIATPQVENQFGFLTDTANWVKISGYFKAQGGEQYITIGNFNSNADTDTLHTGTNNPFFSDAGTAYYYIDSVSLYDSVDYVMNVRNLENEIKFNVYPNPTEGILNVECKMINDRDSFSIVLHDVLGKEVKALAFEEEIDISDLEKGIYFVSVYKEGFLLGTRKVIKD